MNSVQRAIDLRGLGVDAFVQYKQLLIHYLERFIGELVDASADITARIERIESRGVHALVERAARHQIVDVFATSPGEEDAALRRALDGWNVRWAGLRAWFLGRGDHAPQSEVLRARARAACTALVAALSGIHNRRTQRSDRSADYRALARWFAETPSDDDAHRLSRAAFALAPARHLFIDGETLAAREAEREPAAKSWLEASPIRIAPRFRATGAHVRRGRPSAVVDRSEGRALLERAAHEEVAVLAAARARLSTGARTKLSHLGEFDAEEFETVPQSAQRGAVDASRPARDRGGDVQRRVAVHHVGAGRRRDDRDNRDVARLSDGPRLLHRHPRRVRASRHGRGRRMSDGLSFVEASLRSERQRAVRALLMRPMLSASGPDAEDYARVRLHAEWIREWMQRNTGWRLDIDGEVARLRKTPVNLADATRPTRDRKERPFNRRRYVLLCLALAALERCNRQTTLRQLADEIAGCFVDNPALAAAGVTFDLATYDHRRDLVAAIRLLLNLRILVQVQGDEDQYVAQRGDVLYNVQRAALSRMPAFHRGPSTIAAARLDNRVAALLDEPGPSHEEARNRRIRHRLVRRLLDNPFVLFDDLELDERAYLVRQRAFLAAEIHEATGLVAEVRREGLAMVDDRHELSDVAMPEDGTEGHVTLLVGEFLAEHACREPGAPVTVEAIEVHVAALGKTYGKYWRANARGPGAEVHLVRTAIERLLALRVVQRTEAGVVPRAPIGRYALATEMEANHPTTRSGRARRATNPGGRASEP